MVLRTSVYLQLSFAGFISFDYTCKVSVTLFCSPSQALVTLRTKKLTQPTVRVSRICLKCILIKSVPFTMFLYQEESVRRCMYTC